MAEESIHSSTPMPEPVGVDGDAEVAVIPDEFGAVVIGDAQTLEAFTAEWDEAHGMGSAVEPIPRRVEAALEVGSKLLRFGAPTARYVRGSQLWEQATKPQPGTVVTFHKMTRDVKTGQILANPRIAAVGVVPGGGQATLLGLAALELALEQMEARIDARLDVIEGKIDDILRLASAERLGDVYGHLRLLKRHVSDIDNGARLTDTDWSSIAALGADLEVGTERLRHHAVQLVSHLRVEDSADKRADQLKKAVSKGMLGETLGLLLVSQQSLYLWQRLRLERVRTSEPDFLAQTVKSARLTLREHLDADRDLAASLRRVLDAHAVLRVTEVHRQMAGRTLTKYREPLAKTVDGFITARTLQVDDWLGNDHAGIRDALLAARSQTAALTNASRRQISAGASKLAHWIEPKNDTEPATDIDARNDEDDDSQPDEVRR
ncbi:hypothetical protein [Rhodococcus jostii]|uniref:CHAD domain-containing protein n=1 Tax=Rhodococcus jostii TaxID=132919 RepID=A0ABU4CD89_RHOJO|nr:hypothetical protein [Rhodococcus jostii]MDV6281510.1 hypothetical protein [Rhodococcus jostii]